MGINAISPRYDMKSAQVKAFVNMDDNMVQKLAWAKTQQEIDYKKHKRLNTALDLALPVAGGLSAAAIAAKGTRMKAFAKGTGQWGAFIVGVGAAFGLTRAIVKRNENVAEFVNNHPVLNFITTATAAYFAGRGMMKGGSAIFAKLKNTGFYGKALNKAKEYTAKMRNTEVAAKVTEFVKNTVKKTPSPLKSLAKGAASWAPILVVLGSLIHASNLRNKTAKTFNENYTNIKNMQLEFAKSEDFKA